MSDNSVKTRLSVVTIVRSDELGLAETLASVKSIADEMLVVDTGSTDGSREVAIRSGARLLEATWKDSFADVRNMATGHILGDWVLWMDAGETLAPDEAIQLRKFIDTSANATSAYALLVEIPDQGATIARESVARIRLLPDVSGLEFKGRVRESLGSSLSASGLRIEGLPFRIHRGAREHDSLVKARRARRNIQLADLETAQNGPSASMYNCLGEAFQLLNENVPAAQNYRSALECADKGSTDMLEAYYGLLTALDSDPENRETQLKTCLQALEIYPLDAQLLCAMGNYLSSRNQMELAVRSFEAAFRYGQIHPEVWHLAEIREIAVCCRSIAQEILKQDAAVISGLEEGLTVFPNSIRIRRHLMDLHIRQGRRSEALAEFDKLPREIHMREALKSAVRGAALAGSGNWISARAYLRTAYEKGCRDTLCLRWLTATYSNLGETDLALEVAREWKLCDSRNIEVDQFLAQFQLPTESSGRTDTAQRNVRVDSASQIAISSKPATSSTPHSSLHKVRERRTHQ